MKMDEHIEELLPFYALDALTDEERELVEAYLVRHPMRQQVEEMIGSASSLPYGVSPVEPSPRAKQVLMKRVTADADARARSSKRNQPSLPRENRLMNLFPAFSLGVAAVAIVWVVMLNIQLSQLRNQVASLSNALVAQANSLEQINAKLPQTPPSSVVTVSLRGTTSRPQAQGQLIVDPNSSSAVLVIAGLEPLESNRIYQAWLIRDNTPVSAGLLTVDANGQGVLLVNSETTIGSFSALGISIEPEGGSQQPTGDIVVLSDL
jgi:anti-sigma-K factor RskA